MIAHESTNEHPLASLSRFFAAHEATYRRLLATGDIGDHCTRRTDGRAGSPTREEMRRINAEMGRVIERIRGGENLTDIAHDLNINPKTMQARLRNRGLTVRKIRNQ